MTTKLHKHRGYEYSSGELKSHPVKQIHTSPQVMKWHNESLKNSGVKPTTEQKKAARDWHYAEPLAQGVRVEDNWLWVEIDQLAHNLAGVRFRFTRVENNRRRFVSLEIPRNNR